MNCFIDYWAFKDKLKKALNIRSDYEYRHNLSSFYTDLKYAEVELIFLDQTGFFF